MGVLTSILLCFRLTEVRFQPNNWTILHNRQKTGITFHFITNGIDAGSIIEQVEIPLSWI